MFPPGPRLRGTRECNVRNRNVWWRMQKVTTWAFSSSPIMWPHVRLLAVATLLAASPRCLTRRSLIWRRHSIQAKRAPREDGFPGMTAAVAMPDGRVSRQRPDGVTLRISRR